MLNSQVALRVLLVIALTSITCDGSTAAPLILTHCAVPGNDGSVN